MLLMVKKPLGQRNCVKFALDWESSQEFSFIQKGLLNCFDHRDINSLYGMNCIYYVLFCSPTVCQFLKLLLLLSFFIWQNLKKHSVNLCLKHKDKWERVVRGCALAVECWKDGRVLQGLFSSLKLHSYRCKLSGEGRSIYRKRSWKTNSSMLEPCG